MEAEKRKKSNKNINHPIYGVRTSVVNYLLTEDESYFIDKINKIDAT